MIERLCRDITGTADTLLLVEVAPDPAALPQDCFGNVRAKVDRDGGTLRTGWTIWEWPRVLVEAEFHAVWSSPTGELLDITPTVSGETRLLFLPDAERLYVGSQVDNVRRPLRNDALIQDLIAIAEMQFAILNLGDRSRMDRVSLSGDEAAQFQGLAARGAVIGNALARGLTDRCACFCGSKKPYYKCCGN